MHDLDAGRLQARGEVWSVAPVAGTGKAREDWHSPRRFAKECVRAVLLGLFLAASVARAEEGSAPRHPEERDGAALIIHRKDVMGDRNTNSTAPMRLWPLHSAPESRMNYVEVAGRSSMHFHPDADHKLYVLEGRVSVLAGTNSTIATAGDLIIIPKGVRHCYDVPAKGERGLLLTFDAPPYDPKKTVNLKP